jgi:hypothetical protein
MKSVAKSWSVLLELEEEQMGEDRIGGESERGRAFDRPLRLSLPVVDLARKSSQ